MEHTFKIERDEDGYLAEVATSVNTSVQGFGTTVAEAIREAIRLSGGDLEPYQEPDPLQGRDPDELHERGR